MTNSSARIEKAKRLTFREKIMRYFDYEAVAREAKIPPEKLELLAKAAREEFPTDDMVYDLHLMRVCTAIQGGYVTLEEALHPRKAA